MKLSPGLYIVLKGKMNGKIGFLSYQTEVFAHFVELDNESGKAYVGDGDGLRHPASGWYVKKTNVRKLKDKEITSVMLTKWIKATTRACGYIFDSKKCRSENNNAIKKIKK